MQPKPKRAELDRIAEHYELDARGVDVLLEVAEARPGPRASLQFLARMLSIGGLLSLAAAVVFFVAANWSAIAVFGRFALLEVLLVACVVIALIRLPPAGLGRGALFLAFVTTGALLALFGQTYQTGADVYELFLGWALLGLPLVLLANWSVTSASWVLVFNVALTLFCGMHPAGGWLWWFAGGFATNHLVMAACGINLGLWFVFELRPVAAVPEWVRRLVLTCGFIFATWAAVAAIDDARYGVLGLPGALVAMTAVALFTFIRRNDIYPLAVVLGSFIIVSLVWIDDLLHINDEAGMLVLAVWLIITSTVAGKVLAMTSRRWRLEAAT